MYKKIITGFHI